MLSAAGRPLRIPRLPSSLPGTCGVRSCAANSSRAKSCRRRRLIGGGCAITEGQGCVDESLRYARNREVFGAVLDLPPKILEIGENTSEIQRMLIARELTKGRSGARTAGQVQNLPGHE